MRSGMRISLGSEVDGEGAECVAIVPVVPIVSSATIRVHPLSALSTSGRHAFRLRRTTGWSQRKGRTLNYLFDYVAHIVFSSQLKDFRRPFRGSPGRWANWPTLSLRPALAANHFGSRDDRTRPLGRFSCTTRLPNTRRVRSTRPPTLLAAIHTRDT